MNDFLFKNANILQPDRGLAILERSQDTVSIRCPHCMHIGVFQNVTSGIEWSKELHLHTNARTLRGYIRVCPNGKCNGLVFTVSSGSQFIKVYPSELIDFDANGLPNKLLATLKEAISCHAAGAYRASAMMVRRLLEEICDESQATGKDLHARLIELRSKITLPEELFEAMSELKALGNDAAHITAKNYTNIGKDESEDSIELAKEILKARYQLKGLVDRLRARKGSTSV